MIDVNTIKPGDKVRILENAPHCSSDGMEAYGYAIGGIGTVYRVSAGNRITLESNYTPHGAGLFFRANQLDYVFMTQDELFQDWAID